MKIVIDPGHGGQDSGAIGNGLREKDVVLDLSLRLAGKLKKYDCEVILTRDGDFRLDEDAQVDRQKRAYLANDAGADLFFSIHCNGAANPSANGYEDFVYPSAPQTTFRRRDAIHGPCAHVWAEAGRANRGKKTANFQVLRQTRMSAVLVEHGFVSNPTDAGLLKQDSFREKLVDAMEEGLVNALDLIEGGTLILGEPQATPAQAKKFFERFYEIKSDPRKPKLTEESVDKLIDLYWKYGKKTGIRPEILFAQSMKETAYLAFERPNGTPGAVSVNHNNFAGIKTRDASGDRPEDHQTFDSMEDGVRAHFNHICAYTGLEPIGEPHGRYFLVLTISWAGSIRYVEELGARWAPNPAYGESVVDYLNILMSMEVEEEEEDWREEGLRRLKKLVHLDEQWEATDKVDLGTLGIILSRLFR